MYLYVVAYIYTSPKYSVLADAKKVKCNSHQKYCYNKEYRHGQCGLLDTRNGEWMPMPEDMVNFVLQACMTFLNKNNYQQRIKDLSDRILALENQMNNENTTNHTIEVMHHKMGPYTYIAYHSRKHKFVIDIIRFIWAHKPNLFGENASAAIIKHHSMLCFYTK